MTTNKWHEYHFDTKTPIGHQRAPMPSSLPTLRRAAPRLTRLFLGCSHHPCPPRVATQPDKQTRAFGSSTRRASSAISRKLAPEIGTSSPLSFLGKSTRQNANKSKKGFFPTTSQKPVAYWLLGSAASVFGIVVFGGLTRLTESGYSSLFRNG